ncbi:MAG: hypothetical protein OXU74_06630 [Gemmatimonadota bacterium]|nr:hypothetical protein [Gemmatimonadota bacterium]
MTKYEATYIEPVRQKLREAAEHMREMPAHRVDGGTLDGHRVDMLTWFDEDHWLDRPGDCGTVGCIAGHVVAMHDGYDKARRMATGVLEFESSFGIRAAELLGLNGGHADDAGIANALFHPLKGWDKPVQREIERHIDGEHCAHMLEFVADNLYREDGGKVTRLTATAVRCEWLNVQHRIAIAEELE